MRALIGLAILIAMFATAAGWQGRLTEDLKRRRDHQRGAPPSTAEARETALAGWDTLVIGRPSGSRPFFERDRSGRPREARGTALEQPLEELEARPRLYEPDFEVVVRAGDVLSRLCQGHYRRRPEGMPLSEIVKTVAHYNGLDSADDVAAGQVIRLPDIERFVPE